jgi:hypothetical protein
MDLAMVQGGYALVDPQYPLMIDSSTEQSFGEENANKAGEFRRRLYRSSSDFVGLRFYKQPVIGQSWMNCATEGTPAAFRINTS